MRKLVGIDEKITVLVEDVKPEDVPTFRKCYRIAAGQGQSKTADESRRCVRLLNKLQTDGDIELSDEEFKTLMDRVSFNQPQFNTWVHGQLLEKLDSFNK